MHLVSQLETSRIYVWPTCQTLLVQLHGRRGLEAVTPHIALALDVVQRVYHHVKGTAYGTLGGDQSI